MMIGLARSNGELKIKENTCIENAPRRMRTVSRRDRERRRGIGEEEGEGEEEGNGDRVRVKFDQGTQKRLTA